MEHQKIWLLEDEPELAQCYSDFLTEAQYQFRVFSSAEEALHFHSKNEERPSLIVSDIKMPGMDGLTFVETMRKQQIHYPVILMSGYAEKDHLQKALGLNVGGFLEKPFEPYQLNGIIKKILTAALVMQAQEQMIDIILRKQIVSADLIYKYISRCAYAENILHEHQIPLHKDEELVRVFVLNTYQENKMHRELEELNSQIKVLEERRQKLLALRSQEEAS